MPTFASHDGTILQYDVRAADDGPAGRPPLIVLAGGPARHPVYLGDLAGLTRQRTLLVLHQRGVGESASSATAAAAAWPELAEDVEALRRELGLEAIGSAISLVAGRCQDAAARSVSCSSVRATGKPISRGKHDDLWC